jgi:hypothetical protein
LVVCSRAALAVGTPLRAPLAWAQIGIHNTLTFSPPIAMNSHADHLRATLARSRRVNRAIAERDRYEAAQSVPEEIRPPIARPKGLDRGELVNLRSVIMGVLGELHAGAGWEAWLGWRRN